MRPLSATLRAAQQSASVEPYLRVRLFDRDVGAIRLRWQRLYTGAEPGGDGERARPRRWLAAACAHRPGHGRAHPPARRQSWAGERLHELDHDRHRRRDATLRPRDSRHPRADRQRPHRQRERRGAREHQLRRELPRQPGRGDGPRGRHGGRRRDGGRRLGGGALRLEWDRLFGQPQRPRRLERAGRVVAVARCRQRPRRLLRGRLQRARLRHQRGRRRRRLVDDPRGGRRGPARDLARAQRGGRGRRQHEHELPRERRHARRRAAGRLRRVLKRRRRLRPLPPGARRRRDGLQRPAVARPPALRARLGARPRRGRLPDRRLARLTRRRLARAPVRRRERAQRGRPGGDARAAARARTAAPGAAQRRRPLRRREPALALAPGGELEVEPGYRTSAGLESSEGPRFWISAVRRRAGPNGPGGATVEVEAIDGWGLLEAWTASKQLVWEAVDRSAIELLAAVAQRAGLQLTGPGASSESSALQPAFTVRAGERGATAVRRLLRALPDQLLMQGRLPVLSEPAASDPVDYAYGGDHPIEAFALEAGRTAAGWARVFGAGLFAEATDDAALAEGAGALIAVDDNLDLQARADAPATTLLRQSRLAVARGELRVRPNVAQEVGDVVSLTDAASGLSAAPFRVAGLRLRFARGGPRPAYEQTLTLSEV